ncbi:MAG: hypothetical protein PHN51_00385 [Candidatus Nanopelagicales bacterium]|nr:hypothetical protein [Candidatus Nanopelagicales bacterium]
MFGKSLTASWPAGAQIAAASIVAVGGLSLTTSGVWAALQATASNSGNALATSTGTLSLTLTPIGAGIGTTGTTTPAVTGAAAAAISAMAPGDIVYRFIELTNGGSLPALGMTLGVAGSSANELTTSANGLAVAVDLCSVAWTAVTTEPGTCSGTTTNPIASTSISSFGTKDVVGPAVAIAPGAVKYARIKISLPTSSETTSNGELPPGSIQGLSTNLTFTFTEQQRTETTTAS